MLVKSHALPVEELLSSHGLDPVSYDVVRLPPADSATIVTKVHHQIPLIFRSIIFRPYLDH
jgi:hypothetical protein